MASSVSFPLRVSSSRVTATPSPGWAGTRRRIPAAFFSVMARSVIGKYVPVFLAVTLFVAANFQHSPANMGYFSLIMPTGHGPGWEAALGWNIVPAGIGNMADGA